MTRIYYTRDKIKKIDKGQSGICLKCNQHTDSLMHAFWNCEKIKKKWEDIGRWLSIHTDKKVVITPKTCIFQDIEGIRYPTSWQILFCSLIFKKLILQHWKNKEAPAFEKWKALMKYYLSIEKAMSEDQNKKKQFDSQWSSIYNAL